MHFTFAKFNLIFWPGLPDIRISFLPLTMSTLKTCIGKEIRFHRASKKGPWSYQFFDTLFSIWKIMNFTIKKQDLSAKQSYHVHQGYSTKILFCCSFVMFHSNGPLEILLMSDTFQKTAKTTKTTITSKTHVMRFLSYWYSWTLV